MPGDFSVTVPAGFTISYTDEDHKYQIDGEPVTGVTTLLGACLPKGGLDWWAARLVCSGVVELAARGLYPEDAQDAEDLLRAHGLWFTQIKSDAAARGTAVHDAFERLGSGEKIRLSDYGEQRGYVQAINKWWLERSPEMVAQELSVGSKRFGFAGRFDLLCRIDGDLWLVDLKTSKRVYDSHHWQLGLYSFGCEEAGYEMPDRLGVLRVDAEGEFEFVESPRRVTCPEVVLDWYEALREAKAELRVLKRELKEAA